MKRSTFNVLFFVKHTKKLKDGSVPIYARITINGNRTDFGLQRGVEGSQWDAAKGKAKGSSKQIKELNQYLDTVRGNLLLKKRELDEMGAEYTAETFKRSYLRLDVQTKWLLEVFKDHNEQCKRLVNIDFAPGTVVKYQSCYKQLENFIHKNLKRKDVLFHEINPVFLRNFEIYLKTDGGCNHNSSMKYLANLKKIVRLGMANGWLKTNPYATVKLKLDDVDVAYLDEKELDMLVKKEFNIGRIQQVKDVYVFCCFTGMAFSDVKSFCKEDIVDKEGKLWIKKKRQKTKNWFHVPLLEPALRILDKYKNHPECVRKGVLLPVLSNQKMNAYLKEIADLSGIDKHLSTHTARHTFATTVTLGNLVSMEVVSKMLGHSSVNMTTRYARVAEDLINKDMQKVIMKFEPEFIGAN